MTDRDSRDGLAGYAPAGPRGSYPEFAHTPQPAVQNESAVAENTISESAAPEAAPSPAPESTAPGFAAPDATAPDAADPALVPGFEFQSDPDAAPPVPALEQPVPYPRQPPQGSWLHRTRLAFRTWRRSRPFWGGLFVVLGGGEILFSEKAPLRVIVHFGLTGLAGYLIPAVMVLCGVLIVFNPQQRTFYSILSVLLALATWPTSNLGGFLVGMLFGLLGGSLSFAWMPLSAIPAPKAKAAKAKRSKPSKAPKATAQG